jgi:hypothetical protein
MLTYPRQDKSKNQEKRSAQSGQHTMLMLGTSTTHFLQKTSLHPSHRKEQMKQTRALHLVHSYSASSPQYLQSSMPVTPCVLIQ